jgi:hypothetical protein
MHNVQGGQLMHAEYKNEMMNAQMRELGRQDKEGHT